MLWIGIPSDNKITVKRSFQNLKNFSMLPAIPLDLLMDSHDKYSLSTTTVHWLWLNSQLNSPNHLQCTKIVNSYSIQSCFFTCNSYA